jgi:hypothetical protein
MYRHLTGIALTALLCLGSQPLVAAELTYTSSSGHYSLTLPAGWQEIPRARLDAVTGQAMAIMGARGVHYKAGFDRGNSTVFQPITVPYILIQEHDVATPSYDELLKGFTPENLSQVTQKVTGKVGAIKSTTVSNLQVDRKRHILSFNAEMDVVGAGKGKALIAMCLGKNGITQLNCYSRSHEYQFDLQTFNRMVDSLKYEQGHEYDEEEAKLNDPGKVNWNRLLPFLKNLKEIEGIDWTTIGYAAGAGTAVGLLLVIIPRIGKRTRKRVEPDLDAAFRVPR